MGRKRTPAPLRQPRIGIDAGAIYSISEAARLLRVRKENLLEDFRAGKIAGRRTGNAIYLEGRELQAWHRSRVKVKG